ncbi:MAG: S49 family peptidase, partial [Moraxellaceae bacterium]
MSDWPPNPNSKPPQHRGDAPLNQGDALHVLEKAVLASVQEQRRTRRWGIFFKLLTFAYILLLFVILGRGCALGQSANNASIGSSTAHLAVVDIDGTIGSGANDVNSEDVSEALERAFAASGSKAVALKINSPGGSPVQS